MYYAASGNFVINLIENLGDIPDVSSLLQDRLKLPIGIADTAIDRRLTSTDRYLGRNPDGRGTIEAHALLPEALWHIISLPREGRTEGLGDETNKVWRPSRWLKTFSRGWKVHNRKELVDDQFIGVADALARLGVGMAPDPRFALRMPLFGRTSGPVSSAGRYTYGRKSQLKRIEVRFSAS